MKNVKHKLVDGHHKIGYVTTQDRTSKDVWEQIWQETYDAVAEGTPMIFVVWRQVYKRLKYKMEQKQK